MRHARRPERAAAAPRSIHRVREFQRAPWSGEAPLAGGSGRCAGPARGHLAVERGRHERVRAKPSRPRGTRLPHALGALRGHVAQLAGHALQGELVAVAADDGDGAELEPLGAVQRAADDAVGLGDGVAVEHLVVDAGAPHGVEGELFEAAAGAGEDGDFVQGEAFGAQGVEHFFGKAEPAEANPDELRGASATVEAKPAARACATWPS